MKVHFKRKLSSFSQAKLTRAENHSNQTTQTLKVYSKSKTKKVNTFVERSLGKKSNLRQLQ